MTSLDSFRCCKPLKVGTKTYAYYSLPAAEKNGLKGISRLPFSLKVLLENLLRNEDGRTVTKEDLQAVAQWLKTKTSEREIAFRPARVLMQDFTGVPAVVDLAAMRDAMKKLGGDPKKINPLVPVDLVFDHSVTVNFFGSNSAFKKNVEEEYRQNRERYEFLKWSQKSFENFRVVPPGHRHLPPGQSRISVADGVDQEGEGQDRRQAGRDGGRLSGHAGRHRFPHHHGQRPGGARLGRRRHRGGSGHAGPALFDGAARGDRGEAHRQAQGRRHRDRSRAHRHPDAAQARRGRQVRRVLRPRPRQSLDRGPRHHRQHVAGIRRDLRLLPGRRRHAAVSCAIPAAPPAHRAGGGLCQGAGHVPHQDHAGSGLHRRAQARIVAGRAVARRTQAPAGPRRAQGCQARLRHGDGEGVQQRRRRRQGHLRPASVARHLARQGLRQGRSRRSGCRSRAASTTSATATS